MAPAEPAEPAEQVEAAVGSTIAVEVAYGALPRTTEVITLTLHAGATLADALKASGLMERHGLVLDANLAVGVWMKHKPLDTPLRERDRVEIYRPLKVDPKEARRQRFRKQSERSASRPPKAS
jgi:putative ubiquitin-RnfH superfamily antitoxin RatB of RatAB toxin-antitoxin module